MKIRQSTAIVISGLIWMAVGASLLIKGFSLLLNPGTGALLLPILGGITPQVEQASLVLVSIGLVLGFIKGRLVLAKAAKRIIQRILSLENPLSLFSMYDRSYLILLSLMMFMGMSLRWVPIPYDLKGLIDVAIGSALTNGSAFYFRHFAERRIEQKR